ncbi:hypothetical protein PybrP1_001544 [[Pythium] brassicae (nom. inval.)]|nr:hypothetical protein PybrP1_001544 [[Pythium] brassicae (nom. inval.)]
MAAAWGFRSRLPWPAARGERLWAQLTAADGLPAYDVELCEPSAGHVALVLVRKPGSSTSGSTSASTSAPSTPVAAGASAPRVVVVVDAVPPRRRPAAKLQPQSSPTLSPASTASTRSSSAGGATSGDGAAPPLQDVDELDLVDELFAPNSKGGKDGCVLAKAPLLCARFDARVVAIRFTRGGSRCRPGGGAMGAAPPLRCVVALEDGAAFVWEWGADLHQWTFLNQFSFLENPNLAWTRPVAAFAATDLARAGDATEFAWWSREAKREPKLCLRQVQFEQEPRSFRTEITLGHPFALPCSDVVALASSKLGLWIVTKTRGVHFRSAASLRMASLPWAAVAGGPGATTARDPESPELLHCLHNVTGELLVLERATGRVHLVTPTRRRQGHESGGGGGLAAKLLATLADWTPLLGREAQMLAAHRHALLVTTRESLHAFNYLTGERLACVALPGGAAADARPLPGFDGDGDSATTTARLWTIAGAASAAGLWCATGFWFLQTPPAKALASSSRDPKAAFEALAAYGEGLRFDAALQALEVLETVCKSLDSYDERVWATAFASVSSPALLLALFADQNVPEALVDELARLVASLQQVVRDVAAGGRFTSLSLSLPDKASGPQPSPLQRLTPANVEALHHLANWVLLAKRKITRLQTSAHAGGQRRARPRAVSALTTVSSEPADTQPLASLSPLEPEDERDHDAANFRLSRKLRPMSSLRFASGSCAVQHGKQWLLQLESFLLDGVAFKDGAAQSQPMLPPRDGDGDGDGADADDGDAAPAVPSHLLFHEERRLADFRSSVASFSRHMYVESMSRLYLLHEPQSLLPFVACVSEFCPRTFSLSGATRVSRSHAERALSLSPPLWYFTERVRREQRQLAQQQQQSQRSALSSSSSSQRTRQLRQAELSAALATDSLLAYTALLCRCGFYLEACRGLLQCDLFERCQDAVLAKLRAPATTDLSDGDSDLRAVHSAVYFELLEFCVTHRGVAQLTALLERKPPHVSVLHVLRALRTHLSAPAARKCGDSDDSASVKRARHVSVGELRPVLLSLMQQQRAAAAAQVA